MRTKVKRDLSWTRTLLIKQSLRNNHFNYSNCLCKDQRGQILSLDVHTQLLLAFENSYVSAAKDSV